MGKCVCVVCVCVCVCVCVWCVCVCVCVCVVGGYRSSPFNFCFVALKKKMEKKKGGVGWGVIPKICACFTRSHYN